MDRDDLMRRIAELADDLEPYALGGSRLELIIVGGAALMLQGLVGVSRVTEDIDVLQAPFEALPFMRGLDMNNAVSTFPFKMPSGWRGRLCQVEVESDVLTVSTPSPADLVIMKLQAGRRRDINDVKDMLESHPSLVREVEGILRDPLEIEVNVDAEEWDEFIANARRCGINGGLKAYLIGLMERLGHLNRTDHGDSDLIRMAAEGIGDHPRLIEPLLLFAVLGDKLDLLMSQPLPKRVSLDYAAVRGRISRSDLLGISDGERIVLDIPREYSRILDSYLSRRGAARRESDRRRIYLRQIAILSDKDLDHPELARVSGLSEQVVDEIAACAASNRDPEVGLEEIMRIRRGLIKMASQAGCRQHAIVS